MKKKIHLFFPLLALCFLFFAPMCHAQTYGNKSSVGLNLLYDIQLRDGFGANIGSNIGVAAFAEIPVTFSWSLRVFANVYGLVIKTDYDRCAMGGAGILLNVNNAIRGELCRGNLYVMLGAGASYMVEDMDGIGMAAIAGVGYSYWLTKTVNLHAESTFSMLGVSKIYSGIIGIGCSFML